MFEERNGIVEKTEVVCVAQHYAVGRDIERIEGRNSRRSCVENIVNENGMTVARHVRGQEEVKERHLADAVLALPIVLSHVWLTAKAVETRDAGQLRDFLSEKFCVKSGARSARHRHEDAVLV